MKKGSKAEQCKEEKEKREGITGSFYFHFPTDLEFRIRDLEFRNYSGLKFFQDLLVETGLVYF